MAGLESCEGWTGTEGQLASLQLHADSVPSMWLPLPSSQHGGIGLIELFHSSWLLQGGSCKEQDRSCEVPCPRLESLSASPDSMLKALYKGVATRRRGSMKGASWKIRWRLSYYPVDNEESLRLLSRRGI